MALNYTAPTVVGGTDHKTDAGGSTALTPAFLQAILAALEAVSDRTDVQDTLITALQSAPGGIPSFADPNADRIVFWDDSASAYAPLSVASPLRLLGTQLDIPLASVGTYGAIQVASNATTDLGINGSDAVTPASLLYTRGRYVGINAQTGTTYTPVLADQGKLVTMTNAAAITLTLPQDSALAFPVGCSFDVVGLGAGLISFAQGTGATRYPSGSPATRAQYSAATCTKIAANTWLVVGDLA